MLEAQAAAEAAKVAKAEADAAAAAADPTNVKADEFASWRNLQRAAIVSTMIILRFVRCSSWTGSTCTRNASAASEQHRQGQEWGRSCRRSGRPLAPA